MTEDLELVGCAEVPCEETLELSLEELSATKLDRDRLRRSLRKAGIVIIDQIDKIDLKGRTERDNNEIVRIPQRHDTLLLSSTSVAWLCPLSLID